MTPVTGALRRLVEELASVPGGDVATYIPELAKADPRLLGMALASMEGHLYTAGDADVPFTLQSVSKPFVYALAVAGLGLDEVSRWVGAEPTGEAFNAASLDPDTGRPANPMINVGAIVTTALVPSGFTGILTTLSAFAGRELEVDEEVYASEAATGDRNRALAYLVQANGGMPIPAREAVDVYFRQCAVRATAADVAAMAATLGNGGVNPFTGARVVAEPAAVAALAVMASCGMYDAAGDWLLRVGLPAKSGVSGGVIAVSPARFGIAVFSPPLDARSNPVRGVEALRRLSARFGLHVLHNPAPAAPTVSISVRDDGVTVAARGGLDFTTAERLMFALDEAAASRPSGLVVDLSGVTSIEPIAAAMLDAALADASASCHMTLLGHESANSSKHGTARR